MTRVSDRLGCSVIRYPTCGVYEMAQQVQTLFIDDIDGGDAEGTVRFGLDGTDYEIDLNAKHTDELRQILATYVAHARRVSAPTRRVARGRRGATGIDTAKVREW